jgi:hypothetical protein
MEGETCDFLCGRCVTFPARPSACTQETRQPPRLREIRPHAPRIRAAHGLRCKRDRTAGRGLRGIFRGEHDSFSRLCRSVRAAGLFVRAAGGRAVVRHHLPHRRQRLASLGVDLCHLSKCTGRARGLSTKVDCDLGSGFAGVARRQRHGADVRRAQRQGRREPARSASVTWTATASRRPPTLSLRGEPRSALP